MSPGFAYAYTLLGHEYVLVEELEKALACFRCTEGIVTVIALSMVLVLLLVLVLVFVMFMLIGFVLVIVLVAVLAMSLYLEKWPPIAIS